MSGIVQAKNAINKIYSKYAGYINPCLKFILALLVFFVINNRMGYMEKISGGAVVLLVALFCSFMPLAFMALLEGVFILLHMYALSLEMAAVTAVLLFMMYILFLRFTPKEAVVVLLTPIFFIMKVPYLMPLAVGLLGSPISVISVAFGVIMHYVINFASANEEMFSSGADQDMVNRIRAIVDGLLANKSMIVVIICFSVVLVLVYVIRKLKINYSWSIAVGAGAFVNLMLMVVCYSGIRNEFSIGGIVFGTLFSALLALVIVFFVHNLDYRKIENLQFEDDEYYYYVKAVPKMGISPSRKKQTRSAASKGGESSAHTYKTANGVRRTT